MAGGTAKSDDELARTATAATSVGPAAPQSAIGDSLGKFRLERELGTGGMGVVHAAFDPDLERRVALKVLKFVDGGGEARERLLREAKAMARLHHPNVIVVHEVGSAGGRDYVAMELIDGETLADWLKVAERSQQEIVDAFVAAGRGLAHAHATGLVHRDFKPHNVLRQIDGRIVVTDFGLARGVETTESISLETTLPVSSTSSSTPSPPSSLSGLTRTGSVLGTPAYMAPEQWTGGTVGPEADQFAFCVALWEALTGERPYRGSTIDVLKEEVARGPARIDASKLPRRLRRVLRRGLDPDPAKRWPNMNALLDAISRERQPGFLLMSIGGAIVGAALVFVLATRSGGGAGPLCEAPARDPDVVWSAETMHQLGNQRADLATVMAHDVAAWKELRADACKAPAARRMSQLACLDGVLARLDMIRRAAELTPSGPTDAFSAELIEPKVCATADPPKLTIAPAETTTRGFVFLARAARTVDLLKTSKEAKVTAEQVRAFAGQHGLEPCARGLALIALDLVIEDVPQSRTISADAVTAAEQCGDERLRADTLINDAQYHFEAVITGPQGQEAIRKAQIVVARVAQPDLVAEIDLMRANIAAEQWRWQEAFDLVTRASAAFGARGQRQRQLQAEQSKNGLRVGRREVSDLEALRSSVARLRPLAEELHADRLLQQLDGSDAYAQYFLGDVAGGHAAILHAWHPEEATLVHPTRKLDGIVVDRGGRPVAGAMVVAASRTVMGDSIAIGLPFDGAPMKIATTDANGHFAIPDAPQTGALAAQLDQLRSPPVPTGDHVRLVLEPTRRLEGQVELGAVPRTRGTVTVEPIDGTADEYRLVAPIHPDGTFSIDGAPIGRLQVGLVVDDSATGASSGSVVIDAGTSTTKGIKITANKTERTLDVVVRSTLGLPLDTAQILVLPGNHAMTNVADLIKKLQVGAFHMDFARHVVGEQIPQTLLDKVQAGDLVAQLKNLPAGELTACAVGLYGDLNDPTFAIKIQAHIAELQIKCQRIAPDDRTAVIEAPPQKRFD